MKIIEPYYKITTPFGPLTRQMGIQMLRFIETQARISHRSEDRQTLHSWERFIKAVVVGHGDWSVVEHCGLTVTFRTDRGITHEIVRHRIASYTQESTRFVNGRNAYPEGLEFIVPLMRKNPGESFGIALQDAENHYFRLLEAGERPQEARNVLPTGTAATISMSCNLRNWRLFLLMRTTKESHPDLRRLTVPLLKDFKEFIPILYDDIEPESRQIDNMRLAH